MAAPSSVVVHPLVLLSVVDHYNRVAKARPRTARAWGSVHGLTARRRSLSLHAVSVPSLVFTCTLQDTRKRVVGILLGEYQKGRLDVTNSYAGAFENLLRGGSLFPRASFLTCAACHASRRPVPFEEDDRDSSIWFLDHSYHEQMYRMARRINGEHVSLLGR